MLPEEYANEIIRRQGQMEAQRMNWESFWRQIADRILPRQSIFQRYGPNSIMQGEQRTELIFDSTAGLALERFAAAMEWMLIPRTQTWHKLTPQDENLEDSKEVSVYLDQVTKILFQARYSPRANFASQAHESFMSLGAFGTGSMFVDDAVGRSIRYRVVHLSECFFAEDHQGRIDTVHRKFVLTARQIMQRWPDTAPPFVAGKAKQNPEMEIEIIHAVQPRTEVDLDRRDAAGMPWSSCYVLRGPIAVLETGGYWTMPYAISRYVTAPRETYGRSPAMVLLPDIKMINEMSKTMMRVKQKMADPPILLPEDGALQAFDLRPGALNYGGVDDQGRIMAHPFQLNGRVDVADAEMDQRRKLINDGFLVTLFQILVETPAMTATEALLRAQEKGALLAPTMGRQQSEMLGPLIERELDILARAGQLPPMPQALAAAGGRIRIEYSSPLNQMQKADQGVGIARTLETLTPLLPAIPSILDIFDPDEMGRTLAEINGVPAKVLRSPEEIQAIAQQKAQAANMQAMVQAAPQLAGAAKDMANAQATAGNVPGPQPGAGMQQ